MTRKLLVFSLTLAMLGSACGDDEDNNCDPFAPDCPEGALCQPQADGDPVCEEIQTCDLTSPDCPDGQFCVRQPDGEGWCMAPLECALDAPECPDGQVCLVNPDGGAWCRATCDPLAPDACAGEDVCDRLETGEHACFPPVYIAGEVFDLADAAPIPDALVAAADHTGAAVTDVVVTDELGRYELRVPATRDASGDVAEGVFTLRAAAADYLPYPYGIRPAIPVDVTGAGWDGERYLLDNPTTDIGLILLPPDEQGRGSIAGTVLQDLPGGTLVVAECAAAPCPYAFADLSGSYTIFNVPDDDYTVRGFKAGLQLEPADVTVSGAQHLEGVDLAGASAPLATLSGMINIVNPQAGQASSVVLVPESTFTQLSDSFVRGEVPPGLRAPGSGLPPDVTGAFTIEGVPEGQYVVLAGFENDFLVRDPDPGISGTQIVHMEVPDPTDGVDITIDSSFKITGALVMIGPGAEGPEAVDASNLTFAWEDDSSEDFYTLVVYDAFATEVWYVPDVPRVTGNGLVEVDYTGPALTPGMYYQWRAESHRTTGPISTTEDLRGVFYVPGAIN